MKTLATIAHEIVEKHLGSKAGWGAEILMEMLEEAVEVARVECPVPAPMSDERFRTIVMLWKQAPVASGASELHKQFGELIAHIEYIHYVMNGPEAEAIGKAYDDGYNKGHADGYTKGWSDTYERWARANNFER